MSFSALEIHHNPRERVVWVHSDEGNAGFDYFGISVVFPDEGEVDLVTADELAAREARQHRDEIIRIAQGAL